MPILNEIRKSVPDCTYHVNISPDYLQEAIKQYSIDLDPNYQRGYVWTKEQDEKFVGTFLENHKLIPPFWFNWKSEKFNRDSSEIVDGKQRINAILKWMNGEIIAKCPCGVSVWYEDMDKVDIRGLSNHIMMDWNFVELNKIEVMEFYIRLNSGGTIHTEKDLYKVKEMIKREKRKENK